MVSQKIRHPTMQENEAGMKERTSIQFAGKTAKLTGSART